MSDDRGARRSARPARSGFEIKPAQCGLTGAGVVLDHRWRAPPPATIMRDDEGACLIRQQAARERRTQGRRRARLLSIRQALSSSRMIVPGGEAPRCQGHASASKTALRRLDLNPERAGRADRAPHAIVDIGSNSVRLVVYDQLGRAPMPRFNEKSLCRLRRRPRANRRESRRRGFAARSRRCGGFAPSPMRWAVIKIDATGTEAIRRASGMTGARSHGHRRRIRSLGFVLCRVRSGGSALRRAWAGDLRAFPPGWVSGSPTWAGGSLEVAEALG